MRDAIFPAVLAAALTAAPASAEFIGKLALAPKGCEAEGKCRIVHDFKYIDPNKFGWLTKAGDQTDGASIPPWAQPFIGKPFAKEFIKAAVIHDHYCDRHVRPWRQTHKVFYDALLESGLGIEKAKLMYYAVYLGGPKWVGLIPGHDCSDHGDNCQWMLPAAMTLEGAGGASSAEADLPEVPPEDLVIHAAEYDKPGFASELKEVEKLLKAKGDAVTLSALEERAKLKKPNDFYYRSGDAVSKDLVTQIKAK